MRQQARGMVTIAAVVLTAAACGSSSEGTTTSASGTKELTITSPANGASVQVPFTLKFDSRVALGPPDSGKNHVHVYFDGRTNDYTVVASNQLKVKSLATGAHDVQVLLQNADHSPVGPEAAITFNVVGGGPASPSGAGGY